MIIDAEAIDAGSALHTGVCIVGAGAAGITLAGELERAGIDTVVLESGGEAYEPQVQALYQGELAGRRYFPLHVTRLRMLGGSTNHWGGFSRKLDPLDFEFRDWVEPSGWPFGSEELESYYARAHELCELGPADYRLARWEDGQRPRLPLDEGPLRTGIFQNSTPTRFGQRYRDALAEASHVRVILHATVLDIGLHADGGHVRELAVGTLSGRRFTVTARQVVLAAGGIENPRLLLASNRVQTAGIGNRHDQVGRYFMEHPTLDVAELLLTRSDVQTALYRRHTVDDVPVHGFLTPSPETLRTERMLNCGMLLQRQHWVSSSEGARSARRLANQLGAGRWPQALFEDVANVIGDLGGLARAAYHSALDRRLFAVHYWAEQVPNPASRVTLSTERDAFGKPCARLDWRLTEQDWRNFVHMHELFAREIGASGLGRVRLNFDLESGVWPESVHGSHHHIGTTRMAGDPRHGVVNGQGRVHGVDNLYVAGSSVFPTSGQATPTLTIVALALRLAEHLKTVV